LNTSKPYTHNHSLVSEVQEVNSWGKSRLPFLFISSAFTDKR
jgi:hypothetical protein